MDEVVVEPLGEVRACVIWLHGLGADGHDFEPIVPELDLPPGHGVRFVFPHAPARPVTINGGYVMRAWYDVRHPDLRQQEDQAGITDSMHLVNALIARENARGIGNGKIVLAGFSQGGVMALHCGIRQSTSLAGVVALSCYLPLPALAEQESTEAGRTSPIFLAHGTADNIIPIHQGQQSRDQLLALGVDVEWHSYPMSHGVNAQEIADISRFLNQRLGTRRP
jgi:phospholipase/carboxylesterase